ncbi:putative beta-lysine N-acetyltransferase [Desulfosporosinus orientis DSM 765]|uniref:Putative beta-lysine N-acetyltransferase n=1 Tax=Desulfosporosinus orientis (strain ATCC 19365 / DSM 765 / NCIMB 8382 / VKM B-1628 / Singapore I) TaxID=768706 RepID=G7WDN9_DESOD|nr:putative beta-lysine N-acetyltransferase [Desulfosporosinus orientis]AET68364.1 putative beta-lysine N-acetyltransferase [Desulfosporosinus orientis DSM 765]
MEIAVQLGLYETIRQHDVTFEQYVDLHNQRLKLINFQGNPVQAARSSVEMCKRHGMGKIITTVYREDVPLFCENGFILEGSIDGYFKGKTGYCLSHFCDPSRGMSNQLKEEDGIIEKSEGYINQYAPNGIDKGFLIRSATLKDTRELAVLYDKVFETYPTPMNNHEFIANMIKSKKVIFKVAEYNSRIVSAASADLDHELLHAEITDCATLEEFRGKGLLSELVYHLETTLNTNHYITLFSLSRALSLGVNIVFSKHGYKFTGRQINNCHIMGKFEDMNIWVKRLIPDYA